MLISNTLSLVALVTILCLAEPLFVRLLQVRLYHLAVQIESFFFKYKLLLGIYWTRLFGHYKYMRIAKELLKEAEAGKKKDPHA